MTPEESFKKYPYYIYPAIKALDEASGEEKSLLLRRIAAGVGPDNALRTLTGIDPAEFRDFYGEREQPAPDTNEAITEFLDRYNREEIPSVCDNASPDSTEEIPVTPPAIDYASMMLGDTTEEPLPDDDGTAVMLNTFLGGKPATPKATAAPAPPTEEPDDIISEELTDEVSDGQSLQTEPEDLSETLARIMIKNGNYRKALEIMTDLNLKNSKKSIYFADQIRFLNKLIEIKERNKSGAALPDKTSVN